MKIEGDLDRLILESEKDQKSLDLCLPIMKIWKKSSLVVQLANLGLARTIFTVFWAGLNSL